MSKTKEKQWDRYGNWTYRDKSKGKCPKVVKIKEIIRRLDI